MEKNQSQNYAIPVAIVVAGVLIAGALLFAMSNSQNTAGANQPVPNAPEQVDTTDKVQKVSSDDHIKGNPNAKIKIVEYSDFECPFCQRFHTTMNKIVDGYGTSGDVAWVYRHFPLDQLHPRNARKAAVASECAAELGGNDAFWTFTDGYFEMSPANDQTDFDAVATQLIAKAGIDEGAFNACIASGKYDKYVQDDVDNAVATGGRGTPWSIIITPNGETIPINGAQSYEAVKATIESILTN